MNYNRYFCVFISLVIITTLIRISYKIILALYVYVHAVKGSISFV